MASHIETLESRNLCSVAPLAAHPLPFPNVVGTYQGPAVTTTGASVIETLVISKQKNGVFSGATSQANGVSGKFTGTITRTGKVHEVDRGTTVRYVSLGSGTFANNGFVIKYHATFGKQHLTGTLTLSLVGTM